MASIIIHIIIFKKTPPLRVKTKDNVFLNLSYL